MPLQVDSDTSATSNMSALIRAKDWSKTTLGDFDVWPPSLTLVVELLLASGFPMAVRWGPDFTMIYNDGYRPILGDKHPQALGLPFRTVWPEVQIELAPLHESILSGVRSAFFAEDLLLKIQRHGAVWEEAHFTVSYSPIPEARSPSGVGLKADGQTSWLAGYGRVLDRQPDGKAHHIINVATDITERKAAEANQRFLLQELSHRSKNLMTLVQSIADQSFRKSNDHKDFQKRLSGRLGGLAASNTLLARGDWRGSSLHDLIKFQLAPFIDISNSQLEISGPEVNLAADASQAIGLALHELATNAVKHGALSSAKGRLHISWIVDQACSAGGLKLDWREIGGPMVTTPKQKGFGHVVIKSMIEQAVEGTVELNFEKEGLHWSLHAPASIFLP